MKFPGRPTDFGEPLPKLGNLPRAQCREIRVAYRSEIDRRRMAVVTTKLKTAL